MVDVRDEATVKSAIEKTAATFGGLDIVVNNASAVARTTVADTDMKRYDLMQAINTRGTFMVSKYAIPHLEQGGQSAHPDELAAARHAGEMVCRLDRLHDRQIRHEHGGAGTLRRTARQGIAVNALWPRVTIATAAIKNLFGGERVMRMSRTPEIMADAAYAVFLKPAKSFTGHFLIDDSFLAGEGVTDFEKYRAAPGEPLAGVFFVPDTSAATARRRRHRKKMGLNASFRCA